MTQAGSGQNTADPGSNLFWFLALITIAVLVLWFFCREYFIPPLLVLRRLEIQILIWFFSIWDWMVHMFHADHLKYDVRPLYRVIFFMEHIDPKEISIDQIAYISESVGRFYRYPAVLIVLICAYISFFRHPTLRFIKHYSMNTLKQTESEIWPEIKPVLSLNLIQQPLDEGPWAMAQLPLDFCKQHQILKTTKKNGVVTWHIISGVAERIFTLQLGPMWNGTEPLPIYIRALFVVFVMCIYSERDKAMTLLEQIARSATSTQRLNFSGVAELFESYRQRKVLQWVLERHAYIRTIMATLLETARKEGVLASAEFLWLKPLDRRMWYTLNSVGRCVSVIEIAGVYAHWAAEKKVGRRLSTPMVTAAVQGLEHAIGEVLHSEGNQVWRISKEV